ncbi:MAG: GNAT family N-acetyltransferase [Meiothermus sp.]|nr:GNAT family N-acetyltransferase [Meiothermus sp.]
MRVSFQNLAARQYEQYTTWRSGGDERMLEILRREIGLQQARRNQIFVATVDGQIVGTVQLVFCYPNMADGVESAYVQALEVAEEHRRRGIATGLLAYLEAVARELGFKRLTLLVEHDNTPAMRLYAGLGFRKFGQTAWTWQEMLIPALCLEKWLRGESRK